MKLIFLYGPPAVGKLSVAEELAKLTGYKLFHNHLVIDLVESIFEFGTDSFNRTRNRYYVDMIETAAKEDIDGLIFTYVYDDLTDKNFLKKVVEKVEKHNGKVSFVRLFCDVEELRKRTKQESRKRFNKIKTLKILNEVLDKYNFFQDVPFKSNFAVDNTKLSPRQTALKIKKHYDL